MRNERTESLLEAMLDEAEEGQRKRDWRLFWMNVASVVLGILIFEAGQAYALSRDRAVNSEVYVSFSYVDAPFREVIQSKGHPKLLNRG